MQPLRLRPFRFALASVRLVVPAYDRVGYPPSMPKPRSLYNHGTMLETLHMAYQYVLDQGAAVLDKPRLSDKAQRELGRRLATYWHDYDSTTKRRVLKRRLALIELDFGHPFVRALRDRLNRELTTKDVQ